MNARGATAEQLDYARSCRTYESVDPLARLMAQTEFDDDGCLIFTGLARKNGYPVVSEGHDRWHYGHRLVYQRLVGPIPPDRPRIHHRCEKPLCLHPYDLVAVSAAEHAAEHGLGAGPCRACGQDDWYLRSDGGRNCRECRRIRRASQKRAA